MSVMFYGRSNIDNFIEIFKWLKKAFHGQRHISSCILKNGHYSIKHLTSLQLSRSQD